MKPVYRIQNHRGYPAELVALRWYVQDKWVPRADANKAHYREWLFGLKNAQPEAVHLLTRLFCDYWGALLGVTTLLLTVPSGRLHPGSRGAGLRAVAKAVASTTRCMYAEQGLVRTSEARQHDGGMRHSREFQAHSLAIGACPSRRTYRVIVIDDIITTGNTMLGALDRLVADAWHGAPGRIELNGFAFGKTQERPDAAFPTTPQFVAPPWIRRHHLGRAPAKAA